MSTPLRGLGVCTHFCRRKIGWKAEKLLPMAAEMGVSLVRDEILWSDVEKEKGIYAVPQVDLEWMQQATDLGLGINLLLCYGNKLYENPMDPKAYTDYACYMAKELIGKFNIASFELWNEPTNFEMKAAYGGSWSGQEPCLWLEKYAELVSFSAAELKKVAPDIPLIVGPGEIQFYYMAKNHPESLANVDGFGIHPYPGRFPPETVPWGGAQIHERDGASVADDDHSYISLWRRLQECCTENIGRPLQMHTTEWGYTTY
ncbi:MAG: hypothetical protein JXR97_16645, partial [Planctomycetes bacterium]|nr:hypothetical protein [Planctomycetota bacterium]